MEDLQRHVTFVPGFDKRSSDPHKNYGINGGQFSFIIKGPKGAVHFVMTPGFFPRSALEHLINHNNNSATKMHKYPMQTGYDVGYHSHAPRHKGQEICQQECKWLDGKPCYSGGSALRAGEWIEKFLELGTEWLWPALEKYYHEEFGFSVG